MSIKNKSLDELSSLLRSEAIVNLLAEEKKASAVRSLRGEVQSGWLGSFMNDLYSSDDFRVNSETGQKHTVESMVENYKMKMGFNKLLDSCKSNSSEIDFSNTPLSDKLAEVSFVKSDELVSKDRDAQFDSIIEFISDHLGSHRGYSDGPAILYDLRECFGSDTIEHFGKRVVEEIIRLKNEYALTYTGERMPVVRNNTPQKIRDHDNSDSDLFKTMSSIKMMAR